MQSAIAVLERYHATSSQLPALPDAALATVDRRLVAWMRTVVARWRTTNHKRSCGVRHASIDILLIYGAIIFPYDIVSRLKAGDMCQAQTLKCVGRLI